MNESVWEIMGRSKGNSSRWWNVEKGSEVKWSEGNLVGDEMLKKGAKRTKVKWTEVKVFVEWV
jgi:hypothetical protein